MSCPLFWVLNFYPRSPRGERRRTDGQNRKPIVFLSTLPAWGATSGACPPRDRQHHFYPRSPRGERLVQLCPVLRLHDFYPRSPRGERLQGDTGKDIIEAFLSTLPAWGATGCQDSAYKFWDISIHAPRVGSDIPHFTVKNRLDDISIHAPRVGSDLLNTVAVLSAEGISIHAPRVGSDSR